MEVAGLTKLVEAEWVVERLDQPEVVIVDPRRPMKYLSGHLPGALNVPVYKTFGTDGQLLAPDALATFFGASGIGSDVTFVLYDSPEGQNAAMLAWILEYLGRTEVRIMAISFETWKAAGRAVTYKPVTGSPRSFTTRPNPAIRITTEEAREAKGCKFVDFRSREEFSGERAIADDQPGHIPGAVNIVWRDLAPVGGERSEGEPQQALLRPSGEIARLLANAGVQPSDPVIAYCRSGPRAALGYLALHEAGYSVRLFDGSWAQWSRLGLPAEHQGL
jgi:thiosulfate/3-mercaptopyruvate sulfurtransferase